MATGRKNSKDLEATHPNDAVEELTDADFDSAFDREPDADPVDLLWNALVDCLLHEKLRHLVAQDTKANTARTAAAFHRLMPGYSALDFARRCIFSHEVTESEARQAVRFAVQKAYDIINISHNNTFVDNVERTSSELDIVSSQALAQDPIGYLSTDTKETFLVESFRGRAIVHPQRPLGVLLTRIVNVEDLADALPAILDDVSVGMTVGIATGPTETRDIWVVSPYRLAKTEAPSTAAAERFRAELALTVGKFKDFIAQAPASEQEAIVARGVSALMTESTRLKKVAKRRPEKSPEPIPTSLQGLRVLPIAAFWNFYKDVFRDAREGERLVVTKDGAPYFLVEELGAATASPSQATTWSHLRSHRSDLEKLQTVGYFVLARQNVQLVPVPSSISEDLEAHVPHLPTWREELRITRERTEYDREYDRARQANLRAASRELRARKRREKKQK